MSVYTYSQCTPESIVRGDSIFNVCCHKKLRNSLRRHILKNDFLYGTILWFWVIFILTEVYLWRVGC